MLHTIFELSENTNLGIKVINKFYYWSSFKKSYPDSFINILGDILGTSLGWLTAFYLDYLGHKYKWYDPHLIKTQVYYLNWLVLQYLVLVVYHKMVVF